MNNQDRVERALAAYLEYREMGGPEPDTSSLTQSEQEELQELIQILDNTEGVAFGAGGFAVQSNTPSRVDSKEMATRSQTKSSDEFPLHQMLHDALPAICRITRDSEPFANKVGGIDVSECWTVGSFGGRVRICMLDIENIRPLDADETWMSSMSRAFRTLPDTAAIALTSRDFKCLLVQPEDCGPRIEVPSGSLKSRRYHRPIQEVDLAVSNFLGEMLPYWEPVSGLHDQVGTTLDFGFLAETCARRAILEQAAIGARARKSNPKREALVALGEDEIRVLETLVRNVYDGREKPDITEALMRLVNKR